MMWILKLILFFYNDFNPYQVNNTTTFNNVDTAIGFVENNSFSKKRYLFKIVLLEKTQILFIGPILKQNFTRRKVILN
jgi:hypothetical protein